MGHAASCKHDETTGHREARRLRTPGFRTRRDLYTIIFVSLFQRLINKLFAKPWVVHSEANYNDLKNIFDYPGRYVQKVAISNNRIIKLEAVRVYFSY